MAVKIKSVVDFKDVIINPAKLIEVANHLAEISGDVKQNILVDAKITEFENDEGAIIRSFGLNLAQYESEDLADKT
jgi:hypothetical protein